MRMILSETDIADLVRSSSRGTKPKKSVHFAEENDQTSTDNIIWIESWRDMTATEKESIWYTKMDYFQLHRHTKATLHLMQYRTTNDVQLEHDGISFRGLEDFVAGGGGGLANHHSPGGLTTLQHRFQAIQAVLLAQKEQKQQNDCTPSSSPEQRLAERYHPYTRNAIQVALDRAQGDAQAARAYCYSSTTASIISCDTDMLQQEAEAPPPPPPPPPPSNQDGRLALLLFHPHNANHNDRRSWAQRLHDRAMLKRHRRPSSSQLVVFSA